jgi:WhiB family transcriptional regulator, redox-sensing transcriptional regulator
MRAGLAPLITVLRPPENGERRENGEREVIAPMQWRDATVGEQDTTGLSLDLPCTQNPELFFAELPQDVEQAKAMCQGCRARQACLAGALERQEPWGVWGGELLLRGTIVPRKRPRGRPRKDAVAIGVLRQPGATPVCCLRGRLAGCDPAGDQPGRNRAMRMPGRKCQEVSLALPRSGAQSIRLSQLPGASLP